MQDKIPTSLLSTTKQATIFGNIKQPKCTAIFDASRAAIFTTVKATKQATIVGSDECTIMLVGRWNSDAFLAYIEKQVREFTKGVSTRMLQNNTFYNTPPSPPPRRAPQETTTKAFIEPTRIFFGTGQAGSLRHQLRKRN